MSGAFFPLPHQYSLNGRTPKQMIKSSPNYTNAGRSRMFRPNSFTVQHRARPNGFAGQHRARATASPANTGTAINKFCHQNKSRRRGHMVIILLGCRQLLLVERQLQVFRLHRRRLHHRGPRRPLCLGGFALGGLSQTHRRHRSRREVVDDDLTGSSDEQGEGVGGGGEAVEGEGFVRM